MTALAPTLAPSRDPIRHVSREEYAAFLHSSLGTPGSVRATLSVRDRFVRAYPDLATWVHAPLAERIGCIYDQGQRQMICPISHAARPYLFYLAWRGCLRFDWEWLIAVRWLPFRGRLGPRVDAALDRLAEEAVGLGYSRSYIRDHLGFVVSRLLLHTGDWEVEHIGEAEMEALQHAVRAFGERPDCTRFFGSDQTYRHVTWHYISCLHALHVVLYHRSQIATEPRRLVHGPTRGAPLQPLLAATVHRYLASKRPLCRPATVYRIDRTLRHFSAWLAEQHPTITSFVDVTREHVLAYAAALDTMVTERTGQPLGELTKRGHLLVLLLFFRDIAAWGWEDGPGRPLLGRGDIPKMPKRVPRYIPADELARLMEAIRALPCPYQRAALLIARWSGARRGEICRLDLDCLDHYPDGTPRLRIPAGKTLTERLIPLNEEAAAAIRVLQANRTERGLRDEVTGVARRALFMRYGKLLSDGYLFDKALHWACTAAGLVTPDGHPTITAHRFRHTVGTQLAEQGARLHTIMRVLGHTDPAMSMVYAQISDPEVLRDYHAVLGPGAASAGPLAEELRRGTLPQADVDWLKSNFFKTELELGHCLRLPQEGPCECDLYLNCAKFVTTSAYAPRLRRRRQVELKLVEDAAARGWCREVERHRCAVQRLEHLLTELGEPVDGPVEGDGLAMNTA